MTAELNKEQVYDGQLEPLIGQVIAICQQHGISMVASFCIPTPDDADLACSSKLPDGDGKPHPLAGALDRWRSGGGEFMALTITQGARA